MKKIVVCKASSINKKEIEDVEIHIKKNLPDFNKFKCFMEMKEFYKNEALDIYDALGGSLPQGVMHQLLILMLKGQHDLYAGVQQK